MRANRYIPIFSVLAALVLAGLLAACAAVPVPDTPRQSLAVAEITFTGLVEQATSIKPRMSADQIRITTGVIDEVSAALDDAHAAVDTLTLEAKLLIVQQGLIRLRLQLDKGAGPVPRSLGGGGP